MSATSSPAIDPVCGMHVDPATARSLDQDGTRFYFCSDHCRTAFRARALIPPKLPALPLVNAVTAASVVSDPHTEPSRPPAPHAGSYTCPMHPAVLQDHPGSCPICGMALELRVPTRGGDAGSAELRMMQRRLIVAAMLTLPVVILAMAPMLPLRWRMGWMAGPLAIWLQLLCTTPVVWWAGWPFFERGWQSVVTRRLNMFSLISVGVGAAYLFSVSTVGVLWLPALGGAARAPVTMTPLYFESAAVVVVLVLAGQVLELKARRRTGDALAALLDLAPPTARQVAPGGDHIVALGVVQVGDWLRVVPGDQVPVDGVVVDGHSLVEESMITGEAAAVAKAVGDRVTGGTVNGTGSFIMRAERIGADTLLGRIVSMVNAAQRSRAPIQGLADAVAGVFVPVVLGVAVLTFVLWRWLGPEPQWGHALIMAVAVLIIACPCAVGLATPLSVMLGIGRGARAGILIRSAQALQALERVTTIVVDKTGTLTAGRPVLQGGVAGSGHTVPELIALAAALEVHSEHALAQAIVAGAQARSLAVVPATDFQAVPGGGVQGTVAGRRITLGSLAFLTQRHIAGGEAFAAAAAIHQNAGQTVVFVAIDEHAVGILEVADPIKPTTPGAIRALQALGMRVIMLTGDQQRTAQAVARQLGLDDVEAQVDPGAKAARIRALRAGGIHVAMVGDGINDAPALSEADVGIAMGTGTAVAMDSAGITLVGGDLLGVARAVRLSRATMRNIRQNLLFAFLYNALGIPLAAGALYPALGIVLSPMLAGAAMSLSSVSVIVNALRLRHARLSA